MQESNLFKFNLQLHSDVADNAPAVAVEGATPAEPTPAVDNNGSNPPSASNDVPVTSNGQRATVALKTNPLTGRKELVTFEQSKDTTPLQNDSNGVAYNQDGENQQEKVANVTQNNNVEPPKSEAVVDQNIVFDANAQPLFGLAQQQPVSETYKSARELLQAIETNTVDESRIPMELAFQYAAYKNQNKGVTETTASSANANDNIGAAHQSASPSTEEARKQFYNRVEEIAHQAALQDSGLTEEQLAVVEYSDDPDIQARAKQYQTAIAFHRQNVINNVQRKQMEQQQAIEQQQAFMQNVRNEIANLQATEKEFNNIDILMGTMYKQMPYDKAVKYATAIQAFANGTLTMAQADDLRAYYKEARTHYYATKNGYGVVNKPTPVPKVETSGNGSLQQVADGVPKATLTDLRNAAGNRKASRAVLQQLLIDRDARRQ